MPNTKLKYATILITSALFLGGCATITQDKVPSLAEKVEQLASQQKIVAGYDINPNYYEVYQDKELNYLVELALKNNSDLAKAAIMVNKSAFYAKLTGANLEPSFNPEAFKSSAQRRIDTSSASQVLHSANLGVSYTFDLWHKLGDVSDAAVFSHMASAEDLASAKLSLINAVVDNYYLISYLESAVRSNKNSVNSYTQVLSLIENKLKFGVSDKLSLSQAHQALLGAKTVLLANESKLKSAQIMLKNLLNLTENDKVAVKFTNLAKIDVDNKQYNQTSLDIPISALANRPDLKASEYKLRSALKNLNSAEKSYYPSITIGAALGSSSDKFSNTLHMPFTAGNVALNLPFLNYNKIKYNIKMSESDYSAAVVDFESKINTALNEVYLNNFNYNQAKKSYANIKQKYTYDSNITQYYKDRFEAGVVELKDWILSIDTRDKSYLDLLQAKYNVIKSQNLLYKSMAGAYSKQK